MVHVQNVLSNDHSYWFPAKTLALMGFHALEWMHFVKGLNHLGVRLSEDVDSLFWEGNLESCQINAKATYDVIFVKAMDVPIRWLFKKMWKWPVPFKIKCFI